MPAPPRPDADALDAREAFDASADAAGIGPAALAVVFAVCATLPFNGIIAVKRLLLLLLVGAALYALHRRRRWPRLPAPVWAWFALAPLSLLWSVNPRLSAGELLADALYPLLGLLAAVVLADSRRTAPAALAGLFAGALAVSAAGLWQSGRDASYDWQALAHGYGQLSTYLVVVLPFLLLALLEAWRRRRPASGGLLLVLLGALALAGQATGNRMFWLSSLAVVAVVCAGAWRRREFAGLRRPLLAAAGAAGLAGAGAFIHAAGQRAANVIGAPADASLLATFTNSERFEMWRFWLARIPEHPWLGIGFGYDLPRLVFLPVKPAHWHELLFAHAHNVFIDIAIRLGLLGLAVFVAAVVALALRFRRALRDPARRPALAGIAGLALLAGMLSKNLTDDFLTRGPLFAFWLLIGLLLGTLQREQGENRA